MSAPRSAKPAFRPEELRALERAALRRLDDIGREAAALAEEAAELKRGLAKLRARLPEDEGRALARARRLPGRRLAAPRGEGGGR